MSDSFNSRIFYLFDFQDLWDILLTVFVAIIAWIFVVQVNKRLLKYYGDQPQKAFQRHIYLIIAIIAALITSVIFMPFSTANRVQLFQLFGIVLSATIALSSTTIMGNAIAGLMIRVTNSFKLGDTIRVEEYFGRVTEMDILHVEIQTPNRNLTTFSNMYVISNVVEVMQKSGTLVSLEVSLGYDVSRNQIEPLLIAAADDVGLKKPFVQIADLGDFSVVYVIKGLLIDLSTFLATQSSLRARTLDVLHAANIEIASPCIMNTRQVTANKAFIPNVIEASEIAQQPWLADELAFQKADAVDALELMRHKKSELNGKLVNCQIKITKYTRNSTEKDDLKKEKIRIQTEINTLNNAIKKWKDKMENNYEIS